MWKSIYGYAFPPRRSVTYRLKMRSKQTGCSLVAVCEAPAHRAYCFLFLDLWGFLWISADCLWIIWVPQPAGKRLSRVNMSSGGSSKQRRWLCVLGILSAREIGGQVLSCRLSPRWGFTPLFVYILVAFRPRLPAVAMKTEPCPSFYLRRPGL